MPNASKTLFGPIKPTSPNGLQKAIAAWKASWCFHVDSSDEYITGHILQELYNTVH